MASAADGPSRCTENGEDTAEDEQEDPEGGENRDLEEEPRHKQDEAKDDHDADDHSDQQEQGGMDGGCGRDRIELAMFHRPTAISAEPKDAAVTTLGIRRVMFGTR